MNRHVSKRPANCWEYMGCGREPGGRKAMEFGICPASLDQSFHGLNQGVNAGRICWAIAGTLCGGEVQGSYAEKRGSCVHCPFFQSVQEEDGRGEAQTKFLKFLSPELISSFLPNLSYRHVPAGQRFIIQGEVIDRAYIIEQGSCLVLVERGDALHPVRHLGPGDIVGELSLLTGEPQNAHVEAQTDMRLWILNKAQFDDLSQKEPAVWEFLTELVTERFDSSRPLAERVIGKYVAGDAIGRGGYSIIFKGYHKRLKLPVAVKMLRHDLALRPDFQACFWNEAQTIARFNHEHIVKVYDIEELYQTIFIIMELVEGENLKDLVLRSKGLSPLTAVRLLVQAASGLEYAHDRGILHLDVNPSNILVQPGERIKIMDFGMASPSGVDDRGIFDGTIYYMSPEQIEVERVDERSDVYSLGITAYELVTGKQPFPEQDIRAVMHAQRYQELPDPAQKAPGLPVEIVRIIRKACHKDPGQRYRDMEAFKRDLLTLLDDLEKGSSELKSHGPLQILSREHDLIRQFVDKLAIAAEQLERGTKPPKSFFQAALRFYRVFTGRFHHFKEEEVMFTRLAMKGQADVEAEIRALRHQHERGREIMSDLAEAVRCYDQAPDIQYILESLSAYISLMRYHIHIEEYVLYPLVAQTFSLNEIAAMQKVFTQENEKLGGNMLETAQGLIQKMGSVLDFERATI